MTDPLAAALLPVAAAVDSLALPGCLLRSYFRTGQIPPQSVEREACVKLCRFLPCRVTLPGHSEPFGDWLYPDRKEVADVRL